MTASGRRSAGWGATLPGPSALPHRAHLSALTQSCDALRSPGPSPQGPTAPRAPRVSSSQQHRPEQSGTSACSPLSQVLSFRVTEPLSDPRLRRTGRTPRAGRAGDTGQGPLRRERGSGATAREVPGSVTVTYEGTGRGTWSASIPATEDGSPLPTPAGSLLLPCAPTSPPRLTSEHPTSPAAPIHGVLRMLLGGLRLVW